MITLEEYQPFQNNSKNPPFKQKKINIDCFYWIYPYKNKMNCIRSLSSSG